mgnify:FL=1
MVLYLKAESNIPDLVIDFIEVKLKSGKVISLTWDESEFDRKGGYLDARYKEVQSELYKYKTTDQHCFLS